MNERTSLLLSTDIGTDIDDAVALYLAMGSECIDLKGVYVTNGPVGHRARLARYMLALGGHCAPVAVGERMALGTKLPQMTTGAEPFLAPRRPFQGPAIVKGWLPFIAKQLMEGEKMVVASIAPLTNIGKLLEKRPEAAAAIKTLYIMGGRLGHQEHNFSHDSLSAQKVLYSGLDIVIVPADVCSRYAIEADFLSGLGGSSLQEHLSYMARLWKLYHDSKDVLTYALYSRLEKSLPEFMRGSGDAKMTLSRLEGFKRFMFHFSLLCNGHNYRDLPPEQLRAFEAVLGWARLNPESGYARMFLDELREKGRNSFAVSDAFVIYAIEHPERVRVEKVAAACDEAGVMSLEKGEKHRIVTDVDLAHFDAYLRRRLQERPRSAKSPDEILVSRNPRGCR